MENSNPNADGTPVVTGPTNSAGVSINSANTRHSLCHICEVGLVVGNQQQRGSDQRRD